jgi:hypothetical protein
MSGLTPRPPVYRPSCLVRLDARFDTAYLPATDPKGTSSLEQGRAEVQQAGNTSALTGAKNDGLTEQMVVRPISASVEVAGLRKHNADVGQRRLNEHGGHISVGQLTIKPREVVHFGHARCHGDIHR